jgi:regulator of RNase E activity RraB
MDQKVKEAVLALNAATRDPGIPHRLEHYLYFDDPEDAERARKAAADVRFEASGERAADDSAWLMLAVQHVAPSEDAVALSSQMLQDIADECNGEYDGWEAERFE